MKKYFTVQLVFFSVIMWSQMTNAAPLNLSKSDGLSNDECVISGEELTYSICYDNLPNQDDGVYNVILTDKLPAEASLMAADNDGKYDDGTHSVTWDIGSLDAGTTEQCVHLTIKVTALPGAVLSNQATIVSTVNSTELEEKTNAEEITDICPVPVYVDIKPGGCPTPINVGSKGVLPVAVLGTSAFDVTTIDPGSITLAGVFPLRWSLEDVATPYEINPNECNIYDCHELTGDGLVDLTLKFDSEEIAAATGDVYDRDCLVLELTGELKSGLPIKGGDVVSILKKKPVVITPGNLLLLKQ